MSSEAWDKGSEAGQAFAKRCPYPPDTKEESDWHAAWLEGAAKTLGCNYCRTAQERKAKHATIDRHDVPAIPVALDLISLTLALFRPPSECRSNL